MVKTPSKVLPEQLLTLKSCIVCNKVGKWLIELCKVCVDRLKSICSPKSNDIDRGLADIIRKGKAVDRAILV